MSKKYIIATDYDGTLYQYHKGGISDEVRAAIKKFREKGNLFGVVSGRCYRWAYPIFKAEGLFEFDYIISNGGAQCCDSDGNIIFSSKIDISIVRGIFDKAISLGAEEIGVALEKTRYNFSPEIPFGDDVYNPYLVLDTCPDAASTHIVAKDEQQAINFHKTLLEEFSDKISIARNHRCLDITSIGVDKASGIQRYANLCGVDKGCIYSIGDNYNDLPMVSAFHGCAVANAVDELKGAAEYVCEDIAELVNIILSKEKNND